MEKIKKALEKLGFIIDIGAEEEDKEIEQGAEKVLEPGAKGLPAGSFLLTLKRDALIFFLAGAIISILKGLKGG